MPYQDEFEVLIVETKDSALWRITNLIGFEKERGRCQNMKIILTKGYLALKNVQFKID